MTSEALPLIVELDCLLGRAPAGWRGKTLRRLTDLFLVDAASYTDDQVAVFDDVNVGPVVVFSVPDNEM